MNVFIRRVTLALVMSASAATPPAVAAPGGVVVSAQHEASDAGARVLAQGGNAIDAAVAVGYALAVTHPCCGNLGGGGFMLIRFASGRSTFFNFREKAPHAAHADMYLDRDGNAIVAESVDGFLAAGVPGTVLGLETAREKYGTWPRERLLAPAIELAEQGFTLTQGDVDVLVPATEAFRREPNVAAIFLNQGAAFKAGERLVQKNLATTLRTIRDGGADAFYRGAPAEAVAKSSKLHGALLSREDFDEYSITESAPVRCTYRGYTVLSAPPPSSGGVTLCEMLEVLEGYPLKQYGFHTAKSLHVMAEAMRFAYRDRNTYLGDPAFISNPVARLLSAEHVRSVRARIRPNRATPSAVVGNASPNEHATTTHYSVIDAAGNAVAVTYTINDDFGAKVIAGDSGFFLNDEMDDFTVKAGAPNMFGLIQGKANAIAPGKRPLSSMTPTIVLQGDQPLLVLGAPGGSRITTTVLEVISNVIDHGMSLQQAVDAPRVHHQFLPDELQGEPGAIDAATHKALEAMGYKVTALEPWGTGNAAEVIGIAPADAPAAEALGFARAAERVGAADARAPAGSVAVAP